MPRRAIPGFTVIFAGTLFAGWVAAQEIEPINLRAFVGPSQLDGINAGWLFPRGRQVLDGIPFQMDGVIELYGTSPYQKSPGRKAVTDIPVGRIGEVIHLLAATDDSVPDGTIIATMRLSYADQTSADVPVRFGHQVRRWRASMQKAQGALKDPATAIAWSGHHAAAAMQGDYARLFHSRLTNPSPDKIVKSMAVESAGTRAGLWIAGISVGATESAGLSNTIALALNLPDERPRDGKPASVRGVLRSLRGEPLAGMRVRVIGARGLGQTIYSVSAGIPQMWSATTSDADGSFVLPSLPDNQWYSLQVFGEDYQAAYYHGAFPDTAPVEMRLAPMADLKTEAFTARGRVVDPGGRPIAGAMIEFRGIDEQGGGRMYTSGEQVNLPDETATGGDGVFSLSRAKSFAAVLVEISAPDLVRTKVWLGPSNGVSEIPLKTGCSVRGRLLRSTGEPVAGVRVGLSGKEREASVFAGGFATTTGADGTFEFKHIQPATQWWLYGKMASLKELGAVQPRQVITMQDATVCAAGDLELAAGHRVAGTIRTRHGDPLPPGLVLTLGLDQVGDHQTVTPDKSGVFEFVGIPSGVVEIHHDQRNWRWSPANRNLDLWNPWQLVGLVEQDKTDLLIMIERGAREFNNRGNMGNGRLPPGDEPRSRRLAGAEPSGGAYLTLAGYVVDGASGKPVPQFNVIPGRKPPASVSGPTTKPLLQRMTEPFRQKVVPWNEMIWWDYGREESFSNGQFSVDFPLLTSTPVLRIEVPGYDPFISEPMSVGTNGLVFRLGRGAGPSGVVVLPDGLPADGATLVYGGAREQFGLNQRELQTYGDTARLLRTTADGKFAFAARENGEELFAAHTHGWAREFARNGETGIKLRLRPWATVTGTLQQSNGVVMPGVRLHLGATFDGRRPHINTSLYAVTDAVGRFLFTNVPPERLNLNRTIPMGNSGGWTHQLQTWFDAAPGVTNDLGKVIYDSPPAPPMMDQIKKTLGL